jgi:hypothetical protein
MRKKMRFADMLHKAETYHAEVLSPTGPQAPVTSPPSVIFATAADVERGVAAGAANGLAWTKSALNSSGPGEVGNGLNRSGGELDTPTDAPAVLDVLERSCSETERVSVTAGTVVLGRPCADVDRLSAELDRLSAEWLARRRHRTAGSTTDDAISTNLLIFFLAADGSGCIVSTLASSLRSVRSPSNAPSSTPAEWSPVAALYLRSGSRHRTHDPHVAPAPTCAPAHTSKEPQPHRHPRPRASPHQIHQ